MNRRSLEAIKRRREKARKLRRIHIDGGLCVDCGAPATGGKQRCSLHLKHNNMLSKAHAKSEKGRTTRKKYRRGNGRFKNVAGLSKRQGKVWLLSEEVWKSIISMPCFYCGMENNSGGGAGLDRLDNSIGYIQGNVVSCCKECNTARHDNFSPEEMRFIGATIREIKLARKQVY